MTNAERRVAFDMRLAGYNWSYIGDVLGYDSSTVRFDLQKFVSEGSRTCVSVPYPCIARRIAYEYDNSVQKFLEAAGISLRTGRKELKGTYPLRDVTVKKIMALTGLSESEVREHE